MRSDARHRAVRIAIFNHKGGVGKTTLTVNIAAALAHLNKRVLLVDTDPQCNLSSYLVEEEVLDDLLAHSDDSEGRTLWSALRPIAEGLGDVGTIKPVELSIKNLYLICGDIQIASFEQELTTLWNECLQRRARGFRGVNALSQVVNGACMELDADFVFYDCGPNIGALNKVILLDCDYFIIPAACDLFSIRALRTLGHSLVSWIVDWATIIKLAPEDLVLLRGAPKLLGYVPQRFKVYRGVVAQGFSPYLARIERRVNSDIVVPLRKLNSELASVSIEDNKLGQVKDFSTIANASQVQGQPMWHVNAGTDDQRNEAWNTFQAIAKRIVQRASKNA